MRGVDHGLAGLCGWALIAPELHARWLAPLSVPTLLGGGLLAAGASLLPDWDSPPSTAPRTFPGGRFLAGRIARVGQFGFACRHKTGTLDTGHREVTHSFVGVGLVWWGAWVAAGHVWPDRVVEGVLAAMGLYLWRHRRVPALVGAAGFVYASGRWFPLGHWLTVAAVIGAASHVLVDEFNVGGCSLFWPVKYRVRLPRFVRFRVDEEPSRWTPEWWFTRAMLAGTAWVLAARI